MKLVPFAQCHLLLLIFYGVESNTMERNEAELFVHNHCIKETGVDPSFIDKANNRELIPDPKLKCYMACVMETAGMLTADKKIDVDRCASLMYGPLAETRAKNIKKCQTQPGVDFCDTIYQTFACYLKYGPEGFYLP